MNLRLPLLIGTIVLVTSCATTRKSIPTVAQVDIERYSGTWYEIGRYPHSFEKGATHVTATYTLLPDGKVQVVNRSKKNGQPNDIQGTATVVEGSRGAKLKVKFFTWLPAGNYWVIGLDEKNYQWAMVGEGSGKYFWILSRTPKMDDALYQSLLGKAETMGYEPAKVIKVPQG